MQSFNVIPIKDINYLLKSNNLPLTGDKYLSSWNFIITNPNINVPTSIANYVIAYNFFTQAVNIPMMTIFDIIKSNYKIDNLNTERTIQIMRYLNKLDEKDPFVNLPDEIVVKIISELRCEQIFFLCKLSKRFNNICKYYGTNMFDEKFKKYGFYLKKYDPMIMCKALNLNRRIINCGNYVNSDDNFLSINIIVSGNGKVIGAVYVDEVNTNFDINGLENIIGVTCIEHQHILFFLDSFGNVYKSQMNINLDDMDLSLENPELIYDFKNIIQINSSLDHIYFLDIYGTVFKYDNKNSILNNINKIINDGDTFLFLNKNGNVHVIGSDDYDVNTDDITYITKIPNLKNIKNVFMEKESLVAITDNNIINISNKNIKLSYKLIENISKIEIYEGDIFMLYENGNLYKFVETIPEHQELINENIKDFYVDSNFITTLLNSGDIEIYIIPEDKSLSLKIKGDINLLDSRYISIGNKIYHLDIDDDGIKLIEISTQ